MSETRLQLQRLPIGPFQWAAQAAAAGTTEPTLHQHQAYVIDAAFFFCFFFFFLKLQKVSSKMFCQRCAR